MKFLGLFLYVCQAISIAGAVSTEKRMAEYMPSALDILERQLSLLGTSDWAVVIGGWLGTCIGAVIGMVIFVFLMSRQPSKKEAAWLIAFGFALCVASIFWPFVIGRG